MAWRRKQSNTDKARRGLRRIFEPIPRAAVYAAGAVLVALLLSPFWIFLLDSGYQRGPVFLSDDARLLPVPPPAMTTAAPPEAMLTPPPAAVFPLDRYRGLRLNATLDEMPAQLKLRLQNTRGMLPEIYAATKSGNFEEVTAFFYHNQLKEFTVVMPEKHQSLAAAETELVELFGEPQERTLAVTAADGFGLRRESGELQEKLARLPRRLTLRWSDAENTVEATLYAAAAEASRPTVLLMLHVSAARWLAAQPTRLGSGAGLVATNRLAPVEPEPKPLPPLFP
jgi:hypothetical protein